MGDEMYSGNKLVGRVNYSQVHSIATEELILFIFYHESLFATLPRDLIRAFGTTASLGFHVELLMNELERDFLLWESDCRIRVPKEEVGGVNIIFVALLA